MKAPEKPDSAAVAPPLEAGVELVPGYEVVAHLNRSRALDVYDVFSEERACRCVAKVLRPDRASVARSRASLLREGYMLRRLSHPHIVRAYEVVREPMPAVILETLTGDTLEYVIETSRDRRLPLPDLAYLGLHLCSAMHYLHRRNILHLDLKPSNIVSDFEVAKVLDLSIARRPGRGRRGVGTRQYMAPEQARGDLLSPATDAWGVGAVLYEAATGERPFGSGEGSGFEQLERRADPVRARRRLPARLAAAIDACLAPEPANRPNISDLAWTLDAFAD